MDCGKRMSGGAGWKAVRRDGITGRPAKQAYTNPIGREGRHALAGAHLDRSGSATSVEDTDH